MALVCGVLTVADAGAADDVAAAALSEVVVGAVRTARVTWARRAGVADATCRAGAFGMTSSRAYGGVVLPMRVNCRQSLLFRRRS
jgi:hypothetical protein